VRRFVASSTNQRRNCECTDSQPHDFPLLYSSSFVASAHSHNKAQRPRVGVTDDKAGWGFLNGPRRREAASCHLRIRSKAAGQCRNRRLCLVALNDVATPRKESSGLSGPGSGDHRKVLTREVYACARRAGKDRSGTCSKAVGVTQPAALPCRPYVPRGSLEMHTGTLGVGPTQSASPWSDCGQAYALAGTSPTYFRVLSASRGFDRWAGSGETYLFVLLPVAGRACRNRWQS
jgi:hypothetical protein